MALTRSLLLLPALLAACGGAAQEAGLSTTRIIDGRRVVGDFVSPFAYEHFLRGSLAMERGRPEEAIDHFRTALSSDGQSAYLWSLLARAQLGAGQAEAAERSAGRALRLDDRLELAWIVSGEVAESRGDLARAGEAYDAAVRLEPSEEDPSLDRGAYLERRAERTLALQEYGRLLERTPSSLRVRRRFGILLLDLGELDRGIAELERVARASGAERRSILALAAAQMEAGDPSRAAELYRAVLSGDDRSQAARRGLIEALLRLGSLDLATEAIERYRPAGEAAAVALERAGLLLRADQCELAAAEADLAIGASADLDDARLVLGLANERAGRRDQAMHALAAIPRAARSFGEAREAMARILERIGEESAARAVLEDALGAAPESEVLRLALADLQIRSEDVRAAEATLRSGVSPAARVALARLLLRQRRRLGAEELLRAVVERSPHEASAVRLLARLETERGRARDAIARLRRIIRHDRADARSLSLLAVLLARDPRARDQARALSARAVRLAPVDAEVLANAAEVDELRGARATALAGYRKALRFGPDRDLRDRLESRIGRFASGRPQAQ